MSFTIYTTDVTMANSYELEVVATIADSTSSTSSVSFILTVYDCKGIPPTIANEDYILY